MKLKDLSCILVSDIDILQGSHALWWHAPCFLFKLSADF